jgi:hypothetical protein
LLLSLISCIAVLASTYCELSERRHTSVSLEQAVRGRDNDPICYKI